MSRPWQKPKSNSTMSIECLHFRAINILAAGFQLPPVCLQHSTTALQDCRMLLTAEERLALAAALRQFLHKMGRACGGRKRVARIRRTPHPLQPPPKPKRTFAAEAKIAAEIKKNRNK